MASSSVYTVVLLAIMLSVFAEISCEFRSQIYSKHSNSAMKTPNVKVKCEGKSVCSLLKCASMCTGESSCVTFSFKVTGNACYHHDVAPGDPRASVSSDAEWVTYVKGVAGSATEPSIPTPPADCTDIGEQGSGYSGGVYTIQPSTGPVEVKCVVDPEGTWWTAVEIREDNTLSFTRPLADYVKGFGAATSSYWLGLDVIHAMTSSATYEAKLVMTTPAGKFSAAYSGFSVDSAPGYNLRYNTFLGGEAGDALVNFKDQSFVGSDGHEECSFCSGGWWVEKVNFCCGDTPNSPLNGEALWASHDDFYLEKFQILIKRVKE